MGGRGASAALAVLWRTFGSASGMGLVDGRLLFPANAAGVGTELHAVKVEPLPVTVPPQEQCATTVEQPEETPRGCGCASGTSAAVLPGVLALLSVLRRRGRSH